MNNKEIKNIVILIHGVMTKEDNWTDTFYDKMRKDSDFKDWAIEQCEWGYVFFFFSILPFIKYNKIKKVENKIKDISLKYPNARIHILAHSYGTMLIYESIKRTNALFGNIIIVGGIISEFERFTEFFNNNKINNIYNFCSYKDNVIRWQPIFGKCGYWGFVKDKKREPLFKPYIDKPIKNYRFNVHHSEYFTEHTPDFYILWKQLLKSKL